MADNYEKLSNIISIDKEDANIILVNGEWTFRVPTGFLYFTDHEFSSGIPGGIDITGSIKPLVINGLNNGTEYLFNFALERHYDPFGNYGTVVDCKYDNRIATGNSNASQIIIADTDALYVDIMSVNTWPFGITLDIRIRGSKIQAFDFNTMVQHLSEESFVQVVDAMKNIAHSIKLYGTAETPSSKKIAGAPILKEKRVKKEPPVFSDPNFIIDGTKLLKYIGTSADVVLPNGITEIADNTFRIKKIRSVVVPEGVKKIGSRVFESCHQLEEVVLPSSLKELGDYSFVDCHKLKRVTLGRSLVSISNSLFSECFELENVIIPNKVKQIEHYAFKNCRCFTSMVIPSSVESIGFSAFWNCTNLEYLFIPSSVTSILDDFADESPFGKCDRLVVHCPSGTTAEAYCQSHNIPYVIDTDPPKPKRSSQKPKQIKESTSTQETTKHTQNATVDRTKCDNVSDHKVSYSEDLELFEISHGRFLSEPERTRAKAWMQKYKKYLKLDSYIEIDIENSVFAFSGFDPTCIRTESAVQAVIENGGRFQANISDFTDYLVVTLPDSEETNYNMEAAAKQIDKGNPIKVILLNDLDCKLDGITYGKKQLADTLDNVSSKESLIAQNNPSSPKTSSKKSSSRSVERKKEISSDDFTIDLFGAITQYNGDKTDIILPDATSVDVGAFFENKKITSVVIPEGVESIEDLAFWGCTSLKYVFLPGTLRKIGDHAFQGTALTNIVIPEGCEEIGEGCFHSCINLNHIMIPSTICRIASFAFYETAITNIVIPEGCEEIGRCSFSSCKKLESVTLPSTIRKIGDSAFIKTALSDIVIPEGCTEIGEWCFWGCTNLTSVTLPGTIQKIGSSAFQETALTDIVIPEGCKEIGEWCFNTCKSLINVTLPSTIHKINDNIFERTALINIVIPDSCEEIGDCSFADCSSLKNITLPNTIRKIGDFAFFFNALTEIVIPEGCEEIGERSFAQDENIESVTRIYIPSSVHKIGDAACRTSSIIYTEKNSFADTYASVNRIKVSYKKVTNGFPAKEGCYIATAVYGSYDAPQVITLRRFRDSTLRSTVFGRIFIRIYYKFSPPIAEKLKDAKHINHFVRFILNKWVDKLERRQQ